MLGSDLKPDTVSRIAKEMIAVEERHEQEVERLREKHTDATKELTNGNARSPAAKKSCVLFARHWLLRLATAGHTTLKHVTAPALRAHSEVSSNASSRSV